MIASCWLKEAQAMPDHARMPDAEMALPCRATPPWRWPNGLRSGRGVGQVAPDAGARATLRIYGYQQI